MVNLSKIVLFTFLTSSCCYALPRPQDHGGHKASQGQQNELVAKAKVTGRQGEIDADFEFRDVGVQGIHVFVNVNKGLYESDSSNFTYHIHTNPVPSDGNCTKARGHLNPVGYNDGVKCDPQQPHLCQEGDLSGKHGPLKGTQDGTTTAEYIDPYLRWYPQPFSIFGRSIVIHYPNTTRIACGNITSMFDGTQNHDGQPVNQIGNYVTLYRTDPAPPAPTKTITPYQSGTTDTDLLAQITTHPAIPAFSDIENVILTENPFTQTINGNVETVTLPDAQPNPTNPDYVYEGGGVSMLPSQSDPGVPQSVAM